MAAAAEVDRSWARCQCAEGPSSAPAEVAARERRRRRRRSDREGDGGSTLRTTASASTWGPALGKETSANRLG